MRVQEVMSGLRMELTDGKHAETRLHHIGFVILDIRNEVNGFARSIGADWDGKIFHDPLQKVRVSFIQPRFPQEAQIELIEPAAEDSPVLSFLRKGGGLHHLCYEVTDLDSHLRKMRQEGAIIVKPALPAVAFENRRIGWVVTKQKLLLEFLERTKA